MKFVAFVAALSPFALLGCHSEPLDVERDVDLDRFQGKWFEIAHLPRLTQSDCAGTTAFYRRESEARLTMINECHEGSLDGPLRSVSATAVVPDLSQPAKLSVDFGAIYGDYWVIDLGEKYEYAVVGHPTRDYLWILSRTPRLPQAALDGILDRARAKHFDVARLEYTEQP